MENKENKKGVLKEFGLSTLAVNNRKTVYLITTIILLGGMLSYMSMPRESFPELQIPEIYVGVAYPGSSPEFIQDKITSPLEKEINAIKDIDEITSTSIYGYSTIQVKFDFKVSPSDALRKVKDAVDKARGKKDFPKDLPAEPNIFEMDVSKFPILNINLSGEYSVEELKKYAEYLQDKIEALAEVNEVEIRGIQEKELKILIRKPDAEARNVSFSDVENAVTGENMTLSAGEIDADGYKRSLRIEGEFKNWEEVRDIVVKQEDDDIIFLRDVADVEFGDADTTSYARQFNNPVVMLDVMKSSGENLLDAVDKIKEMLDRMKGSELPDNLEITLTMDQSVQIREQVSNLENSIIFGVILVVLVLLFFLGLRNALFVGIAIPLSMFLSFMLLSAAGVTLNVMVLFSLVLALGMLVDNGIVTIENIYRLRTEGYNGFEAAKKGVGEIALAIIASTATTLAAFIPLALWPGIMGEFMKYLPITLIIVLGSSLFVALVINPVLAAMYMKIEEHTPIGKKFFKTIALLIGLGLLFHVFGSTGMGNLLVVIGLLGILNAYVLTPATLKFQNKILPRLENKYSSFLAWALVGKKPRKVFLGTFGLLIFSFILIGVVPPKILFFPENEPNYVNVFIEHPIGTDIRKTNQTTIDIKREIDSLLKPYIPIVKSIIEQVGEGTGDPMQGVQMGASPNKARIVINFVEAKLRKGLNTSEALKAIQDGLTGKFSADVTIIAAKEENGPPQKPPINIEVGGSDNYVELIEKAEKIRIFLENKNVEGVEKLRLDIETGKPELPIEVDRLRAGAYGLTTAQVAMAIRTALFGKDISTYKEGDDSYDVNLRYSDEYRNNLSAILDQKITFRNNTGKLLSIPIRSVIKEPKKTSTYSAVKRKDLENVVTVFSNVKEGYNPNVVVEELKTELDDFAQSEAGEKMLNTGFTFKFTGQQEDQEKEMKFLSTALLIAVFLILLIIVSQFNSFSSPAIILSAVILSLIGVFLGLVIFRQDFVIIMTMIGIISLAGIVVNNAIVLIDYTNLLRSRRKEELGLDETEELPMEDVVSAIVKAGQTRLRPVLLTAITTILGLLPLATGLNIDFITLFTQFDPQIYVGGDNVMFFGPMSWTIIYGLTFATFLTLVVVPITYLLLYRFKLRAYKALGMVNRSNY
ncbi:MAG: efflux RND transporter permease subunit [Flavobacteriales bacterium]